MSWLKKYRKWKHQDFLRWRGDHSDNEQDFFLPEIKGRCEKLLKDFIVIDTSYIVGECNLTGKVKNHEKKQNTNCL